MHPLVNQLAGLVEAHYVLADRARSIAGAIRAREADFGPVLQAWAVAPADPDVRATANGLLLEVGDDKHLGLRRPHPHPDQPELEEIASAAATAGGFQEVSRVEDGIGVLRISPFFGSPRHCLARMDAAFALLAGAPALILDLRDCHGGDSDLVPYLLGHLLDGEPIHLSSFEQRDRPAITSTSRPPTGPTLGADPPVATLTSAGTFSGGEDIAYTLQALGRAPVIGERTGGGAHPVDHFDFAGGVVQIPTGRYVSAATGSNWEGVGVLPDIEAAAADAQQVALRWLRDHLEN